MNNTKKNNFSNSKFAEEYLKTSKNLGILQGNAENDINHISLFLKKNKKIILFIQKE